MALASQQSQIRCLCFPSCITAWSILLIRSRCIGPATESSHPDILVVLTSTSVQSSCESSTSAQDNLRCTIQLHNVSMPEILVTSTSPLSSAAKHSSVPFLVHPAVYPLVNPAGLQSLCLQALLFRVQPRVAFEHSLWIHSTRPAIRPHLHVHTAACNRSHTVRLSMSCLHQSSCNVCITKEAHQKSKYMLGHPLPRHPIAILRWLGRRWAARQGHAWPVPAQTACNHRAALQITALYGRCSGFKKQ